MANAEILPPGIYRIIEAKLGQIGPDRLTRHRGHVTVLPPGDAQPEADQEWRVLHAKDGNVIIQRPSPIRPSTYLTYRGAPGGKPKEGDQIVDHVFEFPPNEWHIGIAPGFRSSLRVAGTNLGIRVAPPKIHPPFLELGVERELYWVFEFVRHED